jgi:predicted HD phosphohydrolase
MEKVQFTAMSDGTREEYEFLDAREELYKEGLVDRLLDALGMLEDSMPGLQVSRLEHSLQSATRALRDNHDEDYIAAALLHDIGDALAPYSHSEMAAAILRPFVSERVYWIVKYHGLFQMYYYAHHQGGDRNARDRFRDHPHYQDAVDFCHLYDQNCFDPNYDSMALAEFEPLLRRVFAAPMSSDSEQSARYGSS